MWLGVPVKAQKEIESEFPGDHWWQVKKCLDYFIDHNPLASWRQLKVALEALNEKVAAEKIRHLLEPLTGKGLRVHPQQELFGFVCLFALLIAACIGHICYFNPENQIDTFKKQSSNQGFI